MKKSLMVGDNCIDIYNKLKKYYLSGNIVDVGVNMSILGSEVSILTNVASDKYGKQMLALFDANNIKYNRTRIIEGITAYTLMDLIEGERVHGDYYEGVLINNDFKLETKYALEFDLVFSAFWGKAEELLYEIANNDYKPLIAFDYADRCNDKKVNSLDGIVDIGFFSWNKDIEQSKKFLKDRVEKGMKLAIATFGEDGSLVYDGNEYYRTGIYEVSKIVNSVGAGDSYIAGFLHEYLKGNTIDNCMKKGAEMASKVIQQFAPILEEEAYELK